MPSNRRSKTIDIGEWLQYSRELLETTDEHISALYAITGHVLHKPQSWLLAHPEQEITQPDRDRLTENLERLIKGEPLPYITGIQEFYGRSFIINRHVLIPRPETELLVEEAVMVARAYNKQTAIADVGTGSGCIAVTLAKEIDDCRITAIDISGQAMNVAVANAAKHDVQEKITFRQNDLLSGIEGTFDILCANLPYIPSGSLNKLAALVHEPTGALDGGEDGFRFIRPLMADLTRTISEAGIALFEIESGQGEQFRSLAHELYPYASIKIVKDLAGQPRLGEIKFG